MEIKIIQPNMDAVCVVVWISGMIFLLINAFLKRAKRLEIEQQIKNYFLINQSFRK